MEDLAETVPEAAPALDAGNAGMTIEQEQRIVSLCQELAAEGVSHRLALQAVSRKWPIPTRFTGRALRVMDSIFYIEDEEHLGRESAFFSRLFASNFREREEVVVDLSEVPVFQRNPASFRIFLNFVERLTEGHDESGLQALGENHVAATLDLLQLSNYFEAPRVEERCITHLVQHRAELVSSHHPSALGVLPWPLLERMLASVNNKVEAIGLVATWMGSAAEDEASNYLQRCCGSMEDIRTADMLLIFSKWPHILAKLPQKPLRKFFNELLREVSNVLVGLAPKLRRSLNIVVILQNAWAFGLVAITIASACQVVLGA